MSKWFCSQDGLSSAAKIAAFDAGYLIAKNNPDKAKAILPVAQGIMATVDKGGSQEGMNAVFQQAVGELIAQVGDPLIQANIEAVLSQVNFNAAAPQPLDNAVIKGLVDSFVNGMAAVK